MFNKINYHNIRSVVNLKWAVFAALLCFGIISCKKDLSDTDSLQAQLGSGMVSYVESSNVVTLNGATYGFTPSYVAVPVMLSNAAKTADTVTSVVDPALVSQYNQIYKETNPTIPDGAFITSSKGKHPVAAGAALAKDSLYVLLNDGSKLKNGVIYLVPVRLASKQGSSLKYSIFFFKVLVNVGSLNSYMYGGSTFNNTSPARLSVGSALSAAYINAYPDSLKWRVAINAKFPVHDSSVQATALTDAELSAVIVRQNWGGTLLMPASNYTISKNLVTIPANSVLSSDSLTVKFTNKAALTKLKYYLAGFKLVTYTGNAYGIPPVATDSSRAYVRVFIIN